MAKIKLSPKLNVISIRVLLLIYFSIFLLTVLFSADFCRDILIRTRLPGPMHLVVYFTMPVALFIFLVISSSVVIRDFIKKKSGSKFRMRIVSYFFITALLAVLPPIFITTQSLYAVGRLWPEVKVVEALVQAQELAVDVYSLKTSNFMQTINKFNFENFIEENKKNIGAKEDILAVQDFIYGTDEWRSAFFTGWGDQRLRTPPDVINGFAARELPRDEDIVRYIDTRKPNIVRVITFNLGAGFDSMMTTIDSETARFESINSISLNKIIPFLLLYFVIFLFPILLITIIIAISFTQNISKPIIDLSEATMQVAEGDFSVHILKSPKDELGELIRNFNVMVQNLEKTQNALARSEKISIWQTMAVQLAHEIKNPLTPIKLTAERVLRRFRDDPQKTQDILEDSMLAIIQEVESLSTLLDEFKTLSRPIEASKSNTNIKDAVNEIIAPYITSCPKVTFSTETMYTSVNVRIEKKHLTQIVNNLVINAIDAMNSDGRIEIKTEIVNKHDTRYCRLSIKDNGKGINPENAKSVWTPYWTTKNSGTGLGLPIVERIVLEYDGGIWFNSASGAGTTFFVDLPVV